MYDPDTYFFLSVEVGAETVWFGPYLDLSQPIMLMGNHIDTLLEPLGLEGKDYTAEVVERAVRNSEWISIHVKVSEDRRRQNDKSQ